MPELRGDLAFVGLSALLRFVSGLGVTGRLQVAGERGEGTLWLEAGNVVGASFGPQRGANALSALAGSAGDGRFRLSDEPALAVREIEAPLEDVLQHVATMDAAFREIRPLLATRWDIAPPDGSGNGGQREAAFVLDREALDVLLAVNRGRHTVDEIAGAGSLVETAHALLRLRDQGLVQTEGGYEVPAEPALATEEVAPAPPPDDPEPQQLPADDVGGPFVPSTEWQEVPAGLAVPPGGEYRLELGGKVYARWPEAAAPTAVSRSG